MDLPCEPFFYKNSKTVEFEVPFEMVDEIHKGFFDTDSIKKILGGDQTFLIKIFSGATLKSKIALSKENKLLEKLQNDYSFLNGKDVEAGEFIVNIRKKKNVALIQVCECLCHAWRQANKNEYFVIDEKSFFEYLLPSANMIVNKSIYCQWTNTIIKVYQKKELYSKT